MNQSTTVITNVISTTTTTEDPILEILTRCNHTQAIGLSELASNSRWSLNLAAILTILIMIVGVLGNSLTVVALLRSEKVRNITAAFIISLAIADALFCLLVLPFSVSGFINGDWVHGDFFCQVFPLFRYYNLGVSLLSIAMITINRYVMITTSPAVYSKIYKPIWIGTMIAFCWIFSFLMQLPTLAGIWGKFGYDALLKTCTIMKDSNGRSSKNALFIIAFLIPCGIIIFCYAKIFWTVHKSEKRMQRHNSARSGLSTEKRKKNEWRITKMVLVIFLSFLACYLPITIIKVLDTCVIYPGLHLICYLLIYMSACINPVIYVLMNKQYRDAFRQVLFPSSLQTFVNSNVAYFQSGKSNMRNYQNRGLHPEQQSQTMISRMTNTNVNIILRDEQAV